MFEPEYVFVRTEYDYSDEFEVYGCYVAEKEQHDTDMAILTEAFASNKVSCRDFSFGTNEAITIDSMSDLEYGLTVVPCTQEFYNEFRAMNRGMSFGVNIIEKVLESIVP